MAIWNDRIRQKRLEKGITLAQIAETLNVTEATAQRYESGSIKTIPYEHICTYAKLFNCTPPYLMGWDTTQKEKMIVKRYGMFKGLATELVQFLKDKEVTYGEALEALEDALSFLERASLKNKL